MTEASNWIYRAACVAGLGVVAVGAIGLLAGCAGSEIPEQEIEPRVVEIAGNARFRWTPERGWIRSEGGNWGRSEDVRVEARKAFDAGYYADALDGFLVLEERGGAVRIKDLNFYIADCYYRLGHYEQALEYFAPVYRRDFPSPQLVDTARQRVFDIGMTYLKGRKALSLLGFSYTSPDHGIGILADPVDGLITENPHLSFADDGLIAIADYYFEDRQFPEAVPLYDRVVAMDADEWNDYAEYTAALAEYEQVRGVDYDQSKMREALGRFRLYLQHHPRGDHWESARAKVREINELEGEKNLRIAKFYLRDSQPRACEIYLRRVLDRYPNSRAAREAREIRKELDRSRGDW